MCWAFAHVGSDCIDLQVPIEFDPRTAVLCALSGIWASRTIGPSAQTSKMLCMRR